MKKTFRDLYKLLDQHKVDYLLIGGQAALIYGVPRATFDVDIFIRKDIENCRKLTSALEEIGFGIAREIDPSEIYKKPIFMFKDQIEITVFTVLAGADAFDVCRKRCRRVDIGDVEVPVISVHDLIKAKEYAGRPKDLEDVRILTSRL